MTRDVRKLTSEEKLLHVIERPDDIERLKLKKKGPRKGGTGSILEKLRLGKVALRNVNKALILISVLMVAGLSIYFAKEEITTQKRFTYLEENAEKEDLHLTAKDKIPTVSEFLAESRKMSPFGVLPDVEKKVEAAKQEKEVSTLKLVGIIWSDEPQAIIEDDLTKKNYLVSEGERIDEYSVEEITRDNVKLTNEDGEKILR
ncbi:MAG: hypothetical protein ABH875_01630 [Candidatus Omnitrophota bacterium]